ncbi:MAG TPA: hypothetical protein PKG99_05815 [Candidatus Syntrophosphaera thermopropionivorans]|nr:hypothetical protein [Candidatus Syntrophosphaera thermopropionivorans]
MNTNKTIPVITLMVVYEYIQLIGKKISGGRYFLPLPPIRKSNFA